MAEYYYKTFKVPLWIHVNAGDKTETALKCLEKFGARLQVWPAENFKKCVEDFGKKGWRHVFENKEHIVIPPELLGLAITDHIQKNLGVTSRLDLHVSIHRIDRRIRSDEDYERIFNDVLRIQEPIVLSQAFQVAENCHDENNRRRSNAWVSKGNVLTQIAGKISDKLITVGEGQGFDIDITEVSKKGLSKFLTATLEELK